MSSSSSKGFGQVELDVGGTPRALRACKLAGVGVELWVIDDAQWPVIVWHTEFGGDNYWKALAFGTAAGPSALKALAPIRAPKVTRAARVEPASGGPLAVLQKAGVSEKKLIAAAEACSKLRDAESRAALLGLLSHGSSDVRRAATNALRARSNEEGLLEAVTAALAACAKEVPKDPGDDEEPDHPAFHRATALLNLLADVRGDEALPSGPARELVRTLALEHRSRQLRKSARFVLSEDPGFVQELVALAATPRALARDAELCEDVVRAVRDAMPLAELAQRLMPIWSALTDDEARASAIHAVLFGHDRKEPLWSVVLLAWLDKLQGESTRVALLRGLLEGPDASIDLTDPERLEQVCRLYVELGESGGRRGAPLPGHLDRMLAGLDDARVLGRLAQLSDALDAGDEGPFGRAMGRLPPKSVIPVAMHLLETTERAETIDGLAESVPEGNDAVWRPLLRLLIEKMKLHGAELGSVGRSSRGSRSACGSERPRREDIDRTLGSYGELAEPRSEFFLP